VSAKKGLTLALLKNVPAKIQNVPAKFKRCLSFRDVVTSITVSIHNQNMLPSKNWLCKAMILI
jgi:hypothetical protein